MPISAKAYAAPAAKQPLAPWAFERRDPRPDDVVIDIHFCGICHSDLHKVDDDWAPGIFPMVPGHEIAGVVRAVGAAVTSFRVGDRVGVGVYVDSCGTCRNCRRTDSNYCATKTATYGARERARDGEPAPGVTYGGYSNVVVVRADHVLRIPDAIPLDKAAPLLCAGITMYSPLAHWKAGPGTRVAIVGMGGLGHVGVKLAAALGAEVTVISQTAAKKDDALRMGATRLVATKDSPSALADLECAFDLIINTISAPVDLDTYAALLDTSGTLVNVGIPAEALALHVRTLISQRRSIAGSAIGSIRETQEMLDFCAAHGVVPDIEVVEPAAVNDAFRRMQQSDVRYRFVIDVGKL